MRTNRTVGLSTFLGASLLAASFASAPADLHAQSWAEARAERMEYKAQELLEERDHWEEAAWYLRSAATLRPKGDPEAVDDLHLAGKLTFYAGDLRQSVADLEAAADRAMDGGDVLTSGNLLVDAAWVAARLGQFRDAKDLVIEAEQVVASPVLSDAVRQTVLGRIDLESGLVVVAADFADDAPQLP